jgi:hypothetical protein
VNDDAFDPLAQREQEAHPANVDHDDEDGGDDLVVAAVLRPPVPIEHLDVPADTFQCAPYAAVLSAGTCVRRQKSAREAKKFTFKIDGDSLQQPEGFPHCVDCVDGKRVALKVGALVTFGRGGRPRRTET